MAIIRIEGFDHYNAATAANKLTLGSNATIDTSGGRQGAGTGALAFTASVVGTSYIAFGGNYSEIWLGFAFQVGSNASIETRLLGVLSNDGSQQVMIHVNNTNQLYITRGLSTIIGVGSAVLPSSGWAFIEMYLKVANSGGRCDVYINGTLDITYTGDTQNSASVASVNRCGFRYGRNYDSKIDDFYVLDALTAPHQTRLGDCRVDTLYTTANGDVNSWTPSVGSNYQNTDERPPDGDTTYNETDTPGAKDLFDMTDLAQDTDVLAVQVSAYTRKTDTADLYARLGTKTNGVEYWSAEQGMSADYAYLMKMFEQNPYSHIDWTRTTLNAAQFGIALMDAAITTGAPTTAGPTTAAPTTV